MNKTGIPWCDYTWNPITGCTKVSAACQNCYAEALSKRFGRSWDVTLHPEKLDEPLRMKKAGRVFVVSMGDLFHDDVDFNWLVQLWRIMWRAPQHKYLILTKRPERMLEFTSKWYDHGRSGNPLRALDFFLHVWMGVTAENQEMADYRVPILLKVPAAVRFVSVEPMLGPVDLNRLELICMASNRGKPTIGTYLDWVICGAETGAGKRWMDLEWARRLRDACVEQELPFFFKKDSEGNHHLLGREWEQIPTEAK